MSDVVGWEGDYSPGMVQPPHAPSEGVIPATVVVSRGGSTEHHRRQGRAILAPCVNLAETAPTKERRQGAEGATIFPISHGQFFHRQILQPPRRLHCSLSSSSRRPSLAHHVVLRCRQQPRFSLISASADQDSAFASVRVFLLLVLVIG